VVDRKPGLIVWFHRPVATVNDLTVMLTVRTRDFGPCTCRDWVFGTL